VYGNLIITEKELSAYLGIKQLKDKHNNQFTKTLTPCTCGHKGFIYVCSKCGGLVE